MSERRFGSDLAGPESFESEPVAGRDGAHAGGPVRSATGDTAGSLLRAARESQGLHIAALAAAIKVSPRKLDALENDRIADLPDATFARALAQTVCRTLKVDAAAVLALLPAAGSTSIEPVSRTAHAPFRERSGRDAPGLASGAIRPMIWAAALLMVAAAVVYLVPESVWKFSPGTVANDLPPAVVSASGDAASSADSGALSRSASPLALGATAGESAPGTVTLPGASAGVVGPQTQGPALLPAVETVFSAPASTVPASSAASGMLQLSASQSSWVEVRDSTGQLLLSRTVQPGEDVGLDGALPLRLTIGNAASTQVGFRGKPIDLGPSIRDNVARLELR